jgi:hypothetical protein
VPARGRLLWPFRGSVALVVALSVSLLTASRAADAAPHGPTAATLYATAITDANAAVGVREVGKVTSSGYVAIANEDASKAGGNAVETFAVGISRFGFSVRLIGSKLYVNGDQDSLEQVLGMDQTTAGFDAGYWRLVPTTSKYFEQVSYGLNLPTSVDQIEMAPPFTLSGPLHFDDEAAYSITSGVGLHAGQTDGPQRGTFVLYVSATKTPLPIAEVTHDVVDKTTQVETTPFSRWGEAVTLPLPKVIRPV